MFSKARRVLSQCNTQLRLPYLLNNNLRKYHDRIHFSDELKFSLRKKAKRASCYVILRRTVFTFLSGVYVYAIAWALFGQDSGDRLGPKNLSDFRVGKSWSLL